MGISWPFDVRWVCLEGSSLMVRVYSMMADQFGTPGLRLDWADVNFDWIKDIVEHLDPPSMSEECHLESRDHYRILISQEPPIDPLGFLVGDFVHDLRAALDNLMFAVSVAENGGPLPEDNRVQFPVCKSSTAFASRREQHQFLGQAARDVVESFQPYEIQDPNASVWQKRPRTIQPLWVLDRLWNLDKHRATHPAFHAFSRKLGYVVSHQGSEVTGMGFKDGPLKDEEIFARVSAADDAQFEARFAFEVGFDEGRGMPGWSLLDSLTELRFFVREVAFPALQPFLK